MNRQRTVCQEIRVLSLILKRFADSTLSELFDREITDVQGRVIGFLYHNQDRPIYQKDVEAEFSITRATTSKMLTLMEKNGLIVRSAVSYDARLKELQLTEKALDYAHRVRSGLDAFETTVTQGLTEEERETLLRLLRKLEDHVTAAGKKGEHTVC